MIIIKYYQINDFQKYENRVFNWFKYWYVQIIFVKELLYNQTKWIKKKWGKHGLYSVCSYYSSYGYVGTIRWSKSRFELNITLYNITNIVWRLITRYQTTFCMVFSEYPTSLLENVAEAAITAFTLGKTTYMYLSIKKKATEYAEKYCTTIKQQQCE